MSSEFRVDDTVFGRSKQSADLMFDLGFSKQHLDILFTAFCDIDANTSGTVRMEEVFQYLPVEQTKYLRIVMSIFENEMCGYLNFLEFTISLWNFLTIDESLYGQLTFELCATKKGNMLSFDDVINIVEAISSNVKDIKGRTNVSDLVAKLRVKREAFTLKSYKQLLVSNKFVMAPLLSAQQTLRSQIIGNSFWVAQTEARARKSGVIETISTYKNKVDDVRKEEIKSLYRKKRDDVDNMKRMASMRREKSVIKIIADQFDPKKSKKKKSKKKKQVSDFDYIKEENGHDKDKGAKADDMFDVQRLPSAEEGTIKPEDVVNLPTCDRKRRSSMLLMKKPSLLFDQAALDKRKGSIFQGKPIFKKRRNRNKPKSTSKTVGVGKYKVAPQKTKQQEFNMAAEEEGEDESAGLPAGWTMKRDSDGEVSIPLIQTILICG